MKKIAKDIDSLSIGIKGLYISKKQKRKKISCIIFGVLIITIVSTSGYAVVYNLIHGEESEWEGRVIIITNTTTKIYDEFFSEIFPNIMYEFDMTQEIFTKKANVEVYKRSDCQVIFDELYGSKNKEDISFSNALSFYIILIDENGNIVMDGFVDEDTFIKQLKDSGFPNSKEN